MSIKKIAVVDPSCFTWPYDQAIVEGLIARGHAVTFITKFLSAEEPGKDVEYVSEIFYPGFQYSFFRSLPRHLFLGLKGVSHIISLLALYLRLAKEKPDIIHFQWVPLPVVDRLFVPLFRRLAPVILTVHDSSPFNNSPSSKVQGMRSIEIMDAFDGLVVHTEKARNALVAHGIEISKITRIEHGVLGKGFAAAVKPMALKAPTEPVNILLFGYLKPYKGADILLEALAKVPERIRSQITLRIAGKPLMDTEALVALAKKLGVEKSVTWDLRFVSDAEVSDMFEHSDITAMPYREIDASGVLMLALAIGRPIVASRIGLFSELIEDEKHGFLVPLEDPEALATAITKLVDNPMLRLDMGNNVRALGASIPSWESIADKTDQLYSRLIAARC